MQKKVFFLSSFFILTTIFSQNAIKDSLLYNTIRKKTKMYQFDGYLKKAAIFFNQKNWDSTLVYSGKYLTTPQKNDLFLNYNYFFRGYSFNKKNLSIAAQEQLELISEKFDLHNSVLVILGEIYLKQKKYEKAVSYFKKAVNLSLDQNLPIKKNNINHNIGICYLLLHQNTKAEKYFKENINQEKDTLILIGNYSNIANLYYQQYKDDIAIPYFEKAYFLSKKITDFNLKKTTARNMAVVEENRKNYKKALVYRKEMEQWKDSLNNQNKIYEVAKAEKEFAVKEKQKEVDILAVENKLKETQRNISLLSVAGLLVLLGIGFYFYKEKIKANKLIATQKENLDALNNTKDKLFSVVSHDLRSSVNALKTSNSGLLDNLHSKNLNVLETLLQKNSAIVNGAYSLLDNLLNWALLQTEQGYFNIDKLRLFFITEQVSYNYKPLLNQKELSFENSVTKKDIVFADQESLKIVLRNLLDNAIKFSEPNGSIKIYSTNTDDIYCNLIVEDTGLGMSEATRFRLLSDSDLLAKKENEDIIGTGLGMQLCKSMIKKNNGKFNIESELGKGTKMIVSLPKTTLNG